MTTLQVKSPRVLSLNFETGKPSKTEIDTYKQLWKTDTYNADFKKLYQAELLYIKQYLESNLIRTEACKSLSEINPNIDLKKLTLDAQNRFYDFELLKILGCYVNLPSKVLIPYSDFNKNYNSKLFWNKVKLIGEGSYGSVYISEEDQTKSNFINFILKYSKHKYSIIHETFISLVLNKYRTQIPNFMFGFGYFECLPPLKTGTKNISSICDLKSTSYYGIYEYVSDISLGSLIQKYDLTLSQFLNLYLQILFSLWTLRELQYSHNDLHPNNILIRPIKSSLIPYQYKNQTQYIKTYKIATIIDYGFNYLMLNGLSYGIYQSETSWAFPDKPNYIIDSYKLFMFSCYIMLRTKSNLLLLKGLEPIFKFFDPNSNFKTALQEQNKNLYNINDLDDTYRHFHLIDYILKQYPNEVDNFLSTDVKGDIPILRCNDGVCLASEKSSEYVQSLKKKTVKDFISFFIESKNVKIPIQDKINTYRDTANPVFNNGFARTRRIMLSVFFRVKNVIMRQLKGIKAKFDVKDIISISELYFDVNTAIDNFGELIISKDALINFYLYFTEQLRVHRAKLIRLINDFERATLDLYNVLSLIRNRIRDNKILIGNIKRMLNLSDKRQKETAEIINKVYQMYSLIIKYIRHLRVSQLGMYTIEDIK